MRGVWRQEPDGRITHQLEPLMLALALLVIPVVLVEESHAPPGAKDAAAAVNWIIWVGFLAELVFVVAVAPRKFAALRAHWLEVAIVVVTPPFFPRALHSLRLARLVRLLRLARLGLLGGRAIRAEHALTSRRGFRYLALLTAFLVAIAGGVISIVDSKDIPNVGTGMWWAIVTVTTVGYGDVYPKSVAGRIVGSLLMLVGIGFISLLTATIASSFVASDGAEDARIDQLLEAVQRLEARLDQLTARP
jgi:voltage-gated potassium channel